MMKDFLEKSRLATVSVIFFAAVSFTFSGYCEKITIAYTGNTYSNLYPCGSCPSSVGGGLSRRAELLERLKRAGNLIVLDSGNFTASGSLDKDSLSPQLDSQRSHFCYKAMSDMGYMFVGLGVNELAFGQEFLARSVKNNKFKYLSANLDLSGVTPYAIKRFSEIKVAVIGISPSNISGLKIKNYQRSLRKVLDEVEAEVDLIILISSLSDDLNREIIKEFPQIKFIFSSGQDLAAQAYEKINDSVIFRPAYRGRTLRLVDIQLDKEGVKDWKFKEERLPLSLKENAKIKRLLPACFKNSDCPPKPGMRSRCENPGQDISACAYYEAKRIEAAVITDKECFFCSIEGSEKVINTNFLGVEFQRLSYNDPGARELIKKYKLKTLPAFIIDKELKKDKNFKKFSKFFTEVKGKLILGPEMSGVFLFLDRKEIPGRIDLFFDFYEDNSSLVYSQLNSFAKEEGIKMDTHFVISNDPEAAYPQEEAEAGLAISYLYPEKLEKYLKLRVENIGNESWIGTLDRCNLDYSKIKRLIDSKKMQRIIKKNEFLIQELYVRDGNVILLNNREIFKVFKIDKNELRKMFQK